MSNKTRVLKFLGILLVLGLIFVALPVHQAEAATGATWYVCPGSGVCDFETIQAAIDAASDGDTILVEPGTYAEVVTINKPNLTIQSTGGAGVTFIDSPVGDLTTGVRVIGGMGIVTFEGFTVQNFTENGILQGMSDHDGTEFHVLNNIVTPFNGYLRNGIQVSGDGSTVIGNTVNGAPLTDSWASSAIMVVNASNAEVSSNTIVGGTLGVDIGISIMNYGGVVDNVLVADNTTIDAGEGIRLSGNATETTMTNVNVIENDFGDGGMGFNVQKLTVDTVSVTGNNFHDNETVGFRFSSTSATVSNATITGNTFTNNYYQFFGGTMSEVEFAPVLGANTFDKAVTTTNWPVEIYSMIQTGVDSSVDGDTVNVSSGTYVEQVVINKSIDLIGAGDSIIEAPATLTAFQFPESTKWWEPVVFAYGGTADGSYIITGTDVVDVTISGFEVDGLDREPGSGHRAAGILLRNADGLVSNNVVRNMLINGSETFGIIAYGDSTITIDSNNVSGWARGGIAANGDAGANADPVATITNNTVAGPGMNEIVTWAPNGIQIGWGATGSIEGNTVTGNGWPGTDWSGTGILVFASDNVLIDDNYVGDNETGISVGGDLWYGTGPAENNVISNNTVESNTYGVSIQSASDYTMISSNLITGSYYDGIDVWGDPKPVGTQIEMNQIVGNNIAEDATSGGLWIQDGVATVDASPNWWGSEAGPYEGQIIGSAEFTPWCGDADCTTFMPNGDGEIVLPPDVTEEEIQTAIDNAPSGSTVVIPAGSYTVDGGFVVNSSGVTIFLSNGAHVENNSPCFVINADYTTINAETPLGAVCVPTSGSNGIDVAAGLTNIVIEGLEIDGADGTNGINFAGVVTDLNIADMYIHGLSGHGLYFENQPVGTVQIQGNLFVDNVGFGILNLTPNGLGDLPAEYNAWGSYDAPLVGLDVSSDVDFTPWTHVDLYMESDLTDYPNSVYLGEDITFDVLGNLVNVMGVDVTVEFPTELTYLDNALPGLFDYEEIEVLGNTVHFVGYQISSGALTVSDQILFSMAFEGNTVGTDLILNLDEDSDVFSMFAGAGSISTNIYAASLSDITDIEVNAYPTVEIVPSSGSTYAGIPDEFTVEIDNTDGDDLASVGLSFDLPAGASLEYYVSGTGWVPFVNLTDLGALASDGSLVIEFRITFDTTGPNDITVYLFDLTPDPDTLLASDDETFTALGDFTVSGTIAMQGRTVRSGVPMTLTDVSGGYVDNDITSTFEISDNYAFMNVNAGIYQFTTNQPRYLNVSVELDRLLDINDDYVLPNLELKGGNAVWTDNVIDLSDASYVGGQYGEPIFDDGDVNFDDRVNIQDLALVGGNYTLTSEVAYADWPTAEHPEVFGTFDIDNHTGAFTAEMYGAYNFSIVGFGVPAGPNLTAFSGPIVSGDYAGCAIDGMINAMGTDILYAEITCTSVYTARLYGTMMGNFAGWLATDAPLTPVTTVAVVGDLSVNVGNTIDLDVLLDGVAPDRPVRWSIYVNNAAYAEIDPLTGELTGLAAGDALVIVTVLDDSNLSYNNTFHVTVNP